MYIKNKTYHTKYYEPIDDNRGNFEGYSDELNDCSDDVSDRQWLVGS